jgi:protoheme IX farnesyltransferase
MAPLVWGERETMDQMLWYGVLLVAITVLPACFGMFGLPYLVAASVLGALLLRGVWRMRTARARGAWAQHAWWVYKYSLLYLALLFAAMVVDRHL